MPAVGSSRMSRVGALTIAQASSRRRCMPPDRADARRFLASVRSTSSSTSATRRPRRQGAIPYSEAMNSTFSRAVRSGYSTNNWGM